MAKKEIQKTRWIKCIELMLDGSLTQKEIAKTIKVSEQTIINWKRNEEFQEMKFKMERELLKDMTSEAFKTLKSLLYSDSDTVRYYAARDILDRSGHKNVEKLEVNSTSEVKVTNNPLEDLSTNDLKKLIDDD